VQPPQSDPIDRTSPYLRGFCLQLQVQPTQSDRIDRASPYFRGFRLRTQVEPTQMDLIDRASPYLRGFCVSLLLEDGDRIQSPKRCVVLNKKQNDA
jgi:hypothetical protein